MEKQITFESAHAAAPPPTIPAPPLKTTAPTVEGVELRQEYRLSVK